MRSLHAAGEPRTDALVHQIADLQAEVTALRAHLAGHEVAAAARERQLERYAADIRETFKRERKASERLRRSYMDTVRALSNAVEARDAYTGKHAERVAAYGIELADAIGMELAHSAEIEFGFLLHDVGKVGVPDAILHKRGPLTDEEFRAIARHPEIGSAILDDIDFLGEAKLVVRHHHERWDGAGYPDRLTGEEIPIAARVFAVADTLDAITSDRPYRPAATWKVAREEIARVSGTQFDPRVVEALRGMPDRTFERIRAQIG